MSIIAMYSDLRSDCFYKVEAKGRLQGKCLKAEGVDLPREFKIRAGGPGSRRPRERWR